MLVGPSTGVWTTNQWPHPQIKVTLPSPSTPNSSSARDGASGTSPTIHAGILAGLLLCCFVLITTAVASS